MNEKGKNNKNGDKDKLPLLDEVNELIEKERLLLSLKLQAQKNEAVEWKSKYDKLADSISANLPSSIERQEDNGYLTRLESLAAVESEKLPVEHVSLHDINGLLKNRVLSWVLDLTGHKIDKMLFGKLAKAVFGIINSYSEITVAIFNSCGLTDDFTPALLSMFRSAQLLAIDLSNNELSDSFFMQLIATLKERRTTPQYILLEGNIVFSRTVRNFEFLLDALTDHTWGLTVSLEDFADRTGGALTIVNGAKAHKNAKRELNVDYKEIVKQPNRVLEFLKAFNDRLNPDNTSSSSSIKTLGKIKGMKKAVFGRMHALHHIAVLGLKNCLLSRRTVKLLADTLRYTAATLTDLDLSFSYIGYAGAEMLQAVLSSSSCQLVRLNIIGNAVGDQGVQTIGRGLVANKSLTYLDARSNNISNIGMLTLFDPLRMNNILVTLDLRGNSKIDQIVALQLRRHLFNQGSPLIVRCSYEEDTFIERSPLSNTGVTIFDYPYKVRCTASVGKPCKLYSIDLTTINLNHASKYGDPVALRWLFRPRTVSTSSIVSKSSIHHHHHRSRIIDKQKKSFNNRSNDTVVDHVSLASQHTTYWEVRVTFNHQDLNTIRHEVDASSSLVSASLMEVDSEWIPCYAVLADLPLKGSIDIYVSCESAAPLSHPLHHRSSSDQQQQQFIAFEGIRLEMNHFPKKPFHIVGGDNNSSYCGDNSLLHGVVSKFKTKLNLETHHALKSLTVLRRLRWMMSYDNDRDDDQHRTTHTLSWKMKLTTSTKQGHKGSAIAITAKKHDHDEVTSDAAYHHALGYEWHVFVFTSEGLCNEIGKGSCAGNNSDDHISLQPWQWTDFNLALTGLRLNDEIILAAKPASDQLDYPQLMLDQCAVEVRDFYLLAQQPSRDDESSLPVSSASLSTIALINDCIHSCFHDDCSLQVPF